MRLWHVFFGGGDSFEVLLQFCYLNTKLHHRLITGISLVHSAGLTVF